MDTYAARLRWAIANAELTQSKLAKLVGVKPQTVQYLCDEKNNAQGLTGIGVNIYSCGRHSDIDTRYNVIYDSTPDMYLFACSPFTDTKRGFTSSERILSKFKRLIFLICNRPSEVPGECARFIRKRIRH